VDYPLSITRAIMGMNALGLGRNSTALYSAGMIASRTRSIFQGLTGADSSSQMDESLILEGYDIAKTVGRNYTDHLYKQSPLSSVLLAFIVDIQMNFPNGTNFSIIATSHGSALRMCL